jgi:hypothetical protein
MTVEPYDFSFPFSNIDFENDVMRESNYVSNADHWREGGTIRFVFNGKGDTRGAKSRLMDFFCSYFTPRI